MRVPAGLLFVCLLGAAITSVTVLVRSLWAYQRSMFRYSTWAIRDELFDAFASGDLTRSPRAVRLFHVAESSLRTSELLTPFRVWALLVTRSGRERPLLLGQVDRRVPRREVHALAAYEKRLTAAWIRLLLFGSPSGWVVLVGLVPWALVQHGFRRAPQSVRETVDEKFVQPTEIDCLVEEAVASGRGQLVLA